MRVNDTAYEIYGRGFGWSWRLRLNRETVATGPRHYDRSRQARFEVDRIREALATVAGDEDAFASPSTLDPQLVAEEAGVLSDVSNPSVVVEEEPTPSGELPPDRDNWVWRLETPNAVLAYSAHRYPTEETAGAAVRRLVELGPGALPVFLVAGEHRWRRELPSVEVGGWPTLRTFLSEIRRGRRHRKYLNQIDTRIVVSGSRGKSSTTRRLDDVFNRRGYDTLTKITGNYPTLIHNGEAYPIERKGPRVTLYENASIVSEFAPELDLYDPEDIAVFENQAITEYTTRLVNDRFVKPDVLVLTNVRQDHNDTLGKTRTDIARSLARSIPEGTHVVNGEQHPVLHEYMAEEIERHGGTIEQVEVPTEHRGLLGAETVHSLNTVLDAIGQSPVPESETEAYLAAIQPEWTHLTEGRIYNAAEVNDIESTELVRRILAGDEPVLPFVYLRFDRRGRTASFAEYVDLLAERELIDRVRVGGANTRAFARSVSVPVTRHRRSDDAATVLEEMLAEDEPIILMGNTVDEFMRDMETAISERVVKADPPEGGTVTNQ